MSELFTSDELSDWLGKTVTAAKAVAVEKVVWGWLKPRIGATVRPDPVPDEVFSWALELAAIAYENPSGLDGKDIGPFGEQYSSERREEILAAAAAGGTGVLAPKGQFPPARPYPDPARG